MSKNAIQTLFVPGVLIFCVITVLGWFDFPFITAGSGAAQTPQDNQELARLHDEDQSDREPGDPKAIDWAVVSKRDQARLTRMKQLYLENRLQTANDYYHAAMILQHGNVPEDFLLAHEFSVVAITKGKNDRHARWLAAASEDRYLMKIGRPQRFGTQYNAIPITAPYRLYTMDSGVTDELRRAMNTPTLNEAKVQEAELNKK